MGYSDRRRISGLALRTLRPPRNRASNRDPADLARLFARLYRLVSLAPDGDRLVAGVWVAFSRSRPGSRRGAGACRLLPLSLGSAHAPAGSRVMAWVAFASWLWPLARSAHRLVVCGARGGIGRRRVLRPAGATFRSVWTASHSRRGCNPRTACIQLALAVSTQSLRTSSAWQPMKHVRPKATAAGSRCETTWFGPH